MYTKVTIFDKYYVVSVLKTKFAEGAISNYLALMDEMLEASVAGNLK